MQGNGERERACPRCNCPESESLYWGKDYLYKTPGTFYVARCLNCGLMFQNPCLPLEGILDSYPKSYGPHAATGEPAGPLLPNGFNMFLSEHFGYRHLFPEGGGERPGPVSCYRHRVRAGIELVPRYVRGGRILEIGCASGRRLQYLRELGWQQTAGIELVETAAERAKELGFQVENGPVESCLDRFDDASLDVVIASMVLEHLYNPFEVVEAVAAKLKPGGEFLFSTIDCGSLDSRIYGPYFAGFDFPRHLVHFRKKDLLQMLGGSFEVLEIYHHHEPVDFVRSSTWRLEDGGSSLFDRMVLKLSETLPARVLGIALAKTGLTCRVSLRCRRKSQ